MNIMAAFFDKIVYIDANWPSRGVHFDFFAVIVSKISFSVLSDLSSLLWKNAANKFLDILSGSEFVAFLVYGNEVEAFAKNRFFSV